MIEVSTPHEVSRSSGQCSGMRGARTIRQGQTVITRQGLTQDQARALAQRLRENNPGTDIELRIR